MKTLLVLGVMAVAGTAWGDVRRYAIVVGTNEGDRSEVTLRYAESDAERVARLLRQVGDFRAEDVTVLTGVQADDVRRAAIAVNARVRESTSGPSLLFIYYSGHGDAQALHLRGTRLAIEELRNLVVGSAATARVLVLDACRSGALTRVKGGRPGPSFAINVDDRLEAEGLAVLTSSAAGEDAQESDALGASFFTHYLASGLIGAADRNADGRVTLAEAFAYASDRTLAATASTLAGPQHPTFRMDLGGREDLVLTHPGRLDRQLGALEFLQTGTYVVHRESESGAVVGEIAAEKAGARLTLPAGRYFVNRRGSDYLLQSSFEVAPGKTTPAATQAMRRVEYAQVVRKGGTQRRAVLAAVASGGVRGDLLDRGSSLRGEAGIRVDLPALSFEARVGGGKASFLSKHHRPSGPSVDVPTRELFFTLAVLRAIDIRRVTLAAGIETGGVWLSSGENYQGDNQGRALGGFIGPLGQIDLALGLGLHLRFEAGVPTYFLNHDAPPPPPQNMPAARMPNVVAWKLRSAYRVSGGIGVHF